MPVKNAVAKAWQKTGGGNPIQSYDGKIYSGYLNGDKPAGFVTAPKIVGTDIKGITLVNNYNGKGSWFKIFGYGLGTAGNFGSVLGAKVYCRDPAGDNVWYEVYSYVEFATSRTFARNQLLRLCVQVGTLGGSQVNGRSLDVKVTVNGFDSNILTAALINQGPRNFYFASPAGNDATGAVNDINHPYRYVQNCTSGGAYLGIWAVWKPGDTIVVRGNGGTWTDQLSVNQSRWMQFPWGPAFPITTGTAPTGNTSGTLTGYYTFYGMPGEDVHGSFNSGGGLQGPSSDQARTGNGKYVQITGFRIDIQGGAARDAGPINFQNGADFWIVTDCECGPWIAGSSSFLNSSGIGGEGKNGYVAFNYVHDIQGLSDLQNHGMYFGGVSGGTGFDAATQNMEICYNWVTNCPGGSNIQFYWQGGNSQYMTGNKIHHNYLDKSAKYNINLGESSVSADVYNNICIYAGWASIHMSPLSASGTLAFNISHNTIYAWNQIQGSTAVSGAFVNEGFLNAGSTKFTHNVILMQARAGAYPLDWYINNGASDSNLSASQNVYWDPDGVKTSGWSLDAAAIFSDPKLSIGATGSGATYVLLAGSSALDVVTTTEAISPSDDFYGIARPSGVRNDAGACEGVGT